MWRVWFLCVCPLGRGEDFQYVDSLRAMVAARSMCPVVGEFGVKCES